VRKKNHGKVKEGMVKDEKIIEKLTKDEKQAEEKKNKK